MVLLLVILGVAIGQLNSVGELGDNIRVEIRGVTDNLQGVEDRIREAEDDLERAQEWAAALERNNREAGRIIENLTVENSDLRTYNRTIAARLAEYEDSAGRIGDLSDRGLELIGELEAGDPGDRAGSAETDLE